MDIFFKRNADIIKNVSHFNNNESFNLHMRKVYYTFKDDLGDSLKEFVKFLSRYSMKCLGVSWQKPATMAKNFGKSEPTIKRYIGQLKKLGIIDRVKPTKGSHFITYFTTGLQLSDLPGDTPKMIHQKNRETATDATDQTVFEDKETRTLKARAKTKSLSNKRYKDVAIQENNTHHTEQTNTPKQLDSSFVPSWVPNKFIEAVKPFFADAKTITGLWTRATYAVRNAGLCGKNEGADQYEESVIESFKTMVYDKKRNAIKGSMFGYFFGVVRNKINEYLKSDEPANKGSENHMLFTEIFKTWY